MIKIKIYYIIFMFFRFLMMKIIFFSFFIFDFMNFCLLFNKLLEQK